MKNNRRAAIIFFVISAAWMLFIWSNSLQPGSSSGSMSGSVTERINAFLKVLGDNLELSHLFIRKAAHFLEFAVLSLLLCFGIFYLFDIGKSSSPRRSSFVLLSVPASFIVAAADETIQLFVDGRAGNVADVMIDTSGACSSAVLFFAVLLIIRLCKSKEK
jgi:VanZ family protein